MDIDEILENAIRDRVDSICVYKSVPELPNDYIQTDSFGEVLEKLVILHIRMWMLEDLATVATDPVEIAALKKKIDTCFKIKRPMYVQAINRMIDSRISTNKTLIEDSVKLYKGT